IPSGQVRYNWCSIAEEDAYWPSRLLSAEDIMKRFPADALFSFAVSIEATLRIISHPNFANESLPAEWVTALQNGILEESKAMAKYMGLQLIEKQAERVERLLDAGGTYSEVAAELRNLKTRAEDELSLRQFVYIENASVYQKPDLFGEDVTKVLPLAQFDVEEAGNCLALGRGTASAFHLMRVMEVMLKRLAEELSIPDPIKEAERSWAIMLRKIHDGIEKSKGGQNVFFSEIESMLLGVKVAWRNPVMHVEGVYPKEQAEDIFQTVKTFSRAFAKGLPYAKLNQNDANAKSETPQ
ncbi:MAG: hypothetical protein WA185_02590, partial [Candidatus Acidiferrales bacterium]